VGVLALPPTAIRSVNAGLIVGNPVGSSNTRAKALTSAELKTIIEASGISYLPLSGGTLTGALSLGANALTCGAITASGTVQFGSTVYRSGSSTGLGTTSSANVFLAIAGTQIIGSGNVNEVTVRQGSVLGFSSTSANVITSADVGISRLAANSLAFGNGAWGNATASISCGAITTSGNLAIRNGLTAMQAEVFGTYTSATSFESLCLKATASAMQIGSAIGSAGGTNRSLQLGHFNSAGTFTSGLSVATDSTIEYSAAALVGWTGRTRMSANADAVLTLFNASSDRNVKLGWGTLNVLAITNHAGSVWTSLRCGSTTIEGDLTITPSASRTLSTNGLFSIEMTSNTAGNLVYRGSDGTTRRNPQVFYASGETQRTLVHAPTWSTYTPAGAATATLLLSDTGSNLHRVTRPTTGNITIAFSGDSANQLFLLVLQTSGSGTPGTVTWPSGITWLTDSGAAPTISTAIDKTDSIMFQRTGSGTYLGWHTGKN
jgi:hypothetical protein